MNKRQRKKRYKNKNLSRPAPKNYIYDLLAHLEEHAAILHGVGTVKLPPVALEVKE